MRDSELIDFVNARYRYLLSTALNLAKFTKELIERNGGTLATTVFAADGEDVRMFELKNSSVPELMAFIDKTAEPILKALVIEMSADNDRIFTVISKSKYCHDIIYVIPIDTVDDEIIVKDPIMINHTSPLYQMFPAENWKNVYH